MRYSKSAHLAPPLRQLLPYDMMPDNYFAAYSMIAMPSAALIYFQIYIRDARELKGQRSSPCARRLMRIFLKNTPC